MSNFPIKLETGDRFWTPEGLGAMGMDPNRAIAELVANSLDWRRTGTFKSIIKIKVGHNFIEITDNGVGMTPEELINAIKVSVANDTLRQNLRIRKGMFGMGMKVACLTLGWHITWVTKSIKDVNIENVVILNTRKFDDPKLNYRENIEGTSRKPDKNSPLAEYESGTSIRIEDLTYKKMVGVSIRDSLQEVFKPELNLESLEIIVEDENRGEILRCEKTEMPIIEGTKINLEELNLYIHVKKTNKHERIKGWLGLMKISRPSGEWGLHLYKDNQIIERYHQLPQRLGGLMAKNPHAEFARAYGEIELSMCAPAFHKIGFDYSSYEWEQVKEKLLPYITEIMEASRDFKKTDADKTQEILTKINKRNKAGKRAAEKLKEYIDATKPPEAVILPDGRWFTIIEPVFKELQEQEVPWIYNFAQQSKELLIIINTKSAVYKVLEDKNFQEDLVYNVITWSISECMYFLLRNEFEFTEQSALNMRNLKLQKLLIKE